MRKVLPRCTLALALFLACEFLLFRTPFYRRWLEPASNAGQVELLLAAPRPTPPAVLVMGDSRVAEGFSAKVADQTAAAWGLHFVNAAASGSTPRSWYYLLRELDPQASRYRAVVLAVDDYEDEDGPWSWSDYPLDLRIAIACLRLTDIIEFPASFHQPAARLEALRGSVLKGWVYKNDILDFLANPAARLDKVRAFRANAAAWSYDYAGNPDSLAGLSVDWSTRSVHFPALLPPAQRSELSTTLLRRTGPQHGDKYRYRMEWLGRILARQHAEKIIFVRLPRAPVTFPEREVRLPSAIRDLTRGQSSVTALDEHAFDPLERPEYFFDDLHLNTEGRRIFSRQLAERLGSL